MVKFLKQIWFPDGKHWHAHRENRHWAEDWGFWEITFVHSFNEQGPISRHGWLPSIQTQAQPGRGLQHFNTQSLVHSHASPCSESMCLQSWWQWSEALPAQGPPACSPSTLKSCPPMLRLVSPHLELCSCRPHPSARLSTFCKHRQGTAAQAEIPTVSAHLRVDWSHASGIRFDFLPALAAEHHSLVLTTCDTQMPGLKWDMALPSSFCEGYPCFWLSLSHISCLHCHLLAPLWGEGFRGDACSIATSLCLLCVLVWRGLAELYLGGLNTDCKFAFYFPSILYQWRMSWVEWKGHLIAWEAGEGPQTH